MILLFVILVVCAYGYPPDGEGIPCFVCNEADSLSSCHQTVKCEIGQYCYLEYVYDQNKNMKYYKGGCRDADICHLQQCAGQVPLKRVIHHHLSTYCSRCCDSPFCNGKLCNIPHTNISGTTLCYGCKNTLKPMACHEIVRCGPDEECSIEAKVLHAVTYDLGCRRKDSCRQLPQVNRKRQISMGAKCCNTALCNDHFFDKGRPEKKLRKPVSKVNARAYPGIEDKNHHHVVLPEHYTCPPVPTTLTTVLPSSTTVSTVQTTTTPVLCEDKPGVDCTELDTLNICDSRYATKYCARYCGRCAPSVGGVVG